MDREIVLIAHNLRSCNNIGSLLRTADGLNVKTVYLTGYSPYPEQKVDTRLPHIKERVSKKIKKTSLGAEETVDWLHKADINEVIKNLHAGGYQLVGLEQTKDSVSLEKFLPNTKIALLVGREVEGLEQELLRQIDAAVSIPMLGKKESFNVVQAAAMAIYKFRYF